jgi:23S rRNA (cytosine1962-C5)-methyltransferase
MVRIELKKGEDRRIREGHPWVFSNEIRAIDGDRLPGISAEVYDASGGFLGIGYYNPRSLIAARILSRRRENIDSTEFFIERIRHALTYRMAVCPGEPALRVVFGEADFLPGLVVDKYDDWLSIQLLTGGMEFRREAILAALTELFRPKGIVARNDVSVRTLEGLEEKVEILSGSIPDTVEITEHGIRLLVALEGAVCGEGNSRPVLLFRKLGAPCGSLWRPFGPRHRYLGEGYHDGKTAGSTE